MTRPFLERQGFPRTKRRTGDLSLCFLPTIISRDGLGLERREQGHNSPKGMDNRLGVFSTVYPFRHSPRSGSSDQKRDTDLADSKDSSKSLNDGLTFSEGSRGLSRRSRGR